MSDDPQPPTGFVDTNVWLYALVASDNASKTARAGALLRTLRPVVNVQVVNEVCVNLLRQKVFEEREISEFVSSFFAKFRVTTTTEATLLESSRLRTAYSLSFWDSLIVSAALESGTSALYTEDMQHGLVIAGRLSIVNPFLDEQHAPGQGGTSRAAE